MIRRMWPSRAHVAPIAILAALVLTCCTNTTPRDNPDADADTGAGDADAADARGDADDDPRSDADDEVPVECGYPTEGWGVHPGDVLAHFDLETCAGESTTFSALWCGHDLTVVHVSTAWCPLCVDATAILLRDVMSQLGGENVALVELLVEGHEHETVATTADCREWSGAFSPDAPTYVPPGGVVEGALRDVFRAMPAPSTFLVDPQGVIRFRTTIALPDRVEEQTAQLLARIREILDEA
jgi:hypothetical protein